MFVIPARFEESDENLELELDRRDRRNCGERTKSSAGVYGGMPHLRPSSINVSTRPSRPIYLTSKRIVPFLDACMSSIASFYVSSERAKPWLLLC